MRKQGGMMESKVIKEETSPCSPSPGSSTSTSNRSTTPTGNLVGKENRRVPSPLVSLTPGEILTRSRSKVLTKESSHPHNSRSESPKMSAIGSSSSSHSPTILNLNKSSSGSAANSSPSVYSHHFTSPHSTTASNVNSNSVSGTQTNTNGNRTPSPNNLTNGSSHGSNSTRTPSSSSSSNNSSGTSAPSSGMSNISGSGGRIVLKIKRFLGTLLHFGCDIGPEIGERVKSLVFNLVSGHLGIEEFHNTLQEVTSFPLRPFVLPFLKSHLPVLQREIGHLARISKQSTLNFVRSHEQAIIEAGSSPGEPCDIFHSEAGDLSLPGKRKSDSLYENGEGSEGVSYMSTPKRYHSALFSPAFFMSHLSGGMLPSPMIPNSTEGGRDYYSATPYPLLSSHSHSTPLHDTPPQNNNNNNLPNGSSAATNTGSNSVPKGLEEEWRNIHVMLNCILSMVEKTKRALSILQARILQMEFDNNTSNPSPPSSNSNSWLRRVGGNACSENSSDDFKRHAGEMMAQALRATEDRVAEVKRRAEEAVSEVKRQAVLEVQRACAVAEARTLEALASERARIERIFLDSRKNNGGESSFISAGPPQDSETCWNCGRKAHETCSGCNMARYCGSFCQHKDWEHHHSVCGRNVSSGSERERERDCRSSGNINSDTKSLHGHENSNSSPINVSNASPENHSPVGSD